MRIPQGTVVRAPVHPPQLHLRNSRPDLDLIGCDINLAKGPVHPGGGRSPREADPLTHEYRVAKKEVIAEVTVAGEKPAVLTLFLAGLTRQHAGDERPSDLLNGPDIFLPAIDRKKKLRLLRR